MAMTYEEQSVRTQCESNWRANPQLRAEFGHSFDRYLAFRMADARGLIRGKHSLRPEGYILPKER